MMNFMNFFVCQGSIVLLSDAIACGAIRDVRNFLPLFPNFVRAPASPLTV